MKIVAWILGSMAVAGLVILAIAGLTAATAVLVTGAAVVALVVLGTTFGGRSGRRS